MAKTKSKKIASKKTKSSQLAPIPLPKRGKLLRKMEGNFLDFAISQPITIQNVSPELDGGRFAVKREVGDVIEVWADIFKDGHERLKADILYRKIKEKEWHKKPMELFNSGLLRWRGSFSFEENARYIYTIEARVDEYGTWCDSTGKKRNAGQSIELDLIEGREIIAATLKRIEKLKTSKNEETYKADHDLLQYVLKSYDFATKVDFSEIERTRAVLMFAEPVVEAMDRWHDPAKITRYDKELEVWVDRVKARFAAWYEMFPRSQGTDPTRSATFKECELRLPEIQKMGFDVVYLAPIHPIGKKHRKGKNNTLDCNPNDPGSPYAIGSKEGGHKSIHPELGTLEDFKDFVKAVNNHGMEVALDFAIQCAPDHPWVKEHPEWFSFRPDGTIKYAENPPKKYEDIVNVNFYGSHAEELWNEMLDTVLFWIDCGVKVFRVDNPHTKSVPFWEWLIRTITCNYPDVIFLAEAFTKPPMMKMLAKVGFSQSYTYFTWRNDKHSLIEYLTELTCSEPKEQVAPSTCTEVVEYMRPNFFTNTPDILPFFLQQDGATPFVIRFTLAATLSSLYGIYSGFELCENKALPDREEYLNSEKYEYKVWDWDRQGNIKDFISSINRIRNENPALHEMDNLRFCSSSDDNILFYGKMTPDRSNMVFVIVNLDPNGAHSADIEYPLHDMGIPDWGRFKVEDLLSGGSFEQRGSRQYIHLYPAGMQVAVYRITPIDTL